MNIEGIISAIIAIIFTGLINYPISHALAKHQRFNVFIIPGFLLTLSIALLILGLYDQGFGQLGLILLAAFVGLAFLGTLISSIILFVTTKNKE